MGERRVRNAKVGSSNFRHSTSFSYLFQRPAAVMPVSQLVMHPHWHTYGTVGYTNGNDQETRQ